MTNNMFSIHISLFDGQSHTLPIPRKFLPCYVDPSGSITAEGLIFLSNQFYFLNQIRSGMVRCTNFKSLIMLFAHKTVIRDSIAIKTSFATREMKDCSKIFNHTHIAMDNFLTPEGIELVFGSQQFNIAWIHVNNYIPVFNEYYEYCLALVSQPSTHQSSGFASIGVSGFSGFGGFSGFSVPYQKTNQPKLAPLVPLCPPKGFFIEEPKDSEKIDVSKLKFFTGGEPIEPKTPQKKHTADEELVCPGAPKKGRM